MPDCQNITTLNNEVRYKNNNKNIPLFDIRSNKNTGSGKLFTLLCQHIMDTKTKFDNEAILVGEKKPFNQRAYDFRCIAKFIRTMDGIRFDRLAPLLNTVSVAVLEEIVEKKDLKGGIKSAPTVALWFIKRYRQDLVASLSIGQPRNSIDFAKLLDRELEDRGVDLKQSCGRTGNSYMAGYFDRLSGNYRDAAHGHPK